MVRQGGPALWKPSPASSPSCRCPVTTAIFTAMRFSRLSAVKALYRFDVAIRPGIESLNDPGFPGHPERGRLNWRSAWRWRARPNPRSEQCSIGIASLRRGATEELTLIAERRPTGAPRDPGPPLILAIFGLTGSGGFISIGACGASSRGFVQPPGCLALRYQERRWCAIHGP